MGANSELGATLRLDYDKAAAAATNKALQEASKNTKALTEANNDSAKAFDKAFNASREAAKGAASAAKAGNALPPPGGSTEGSGGLPTAAKFRGAASLVGGGDLVGLVDDIQDLGEGVGQFAKSLGLSIGQLGGAAVIAAPFVIALGLAVGELQKNIQKSIEAINAGAETVLDVNKFLATSTSDQVKARIDATEAEKAAVEKTVKDIQEAQKKFLQQSGSTEAIQAANPKYREFTKQIEANQTEVARLTLESRLLGEGLDDTTVAANDAVEAEKKLTAERTKSVLDSAAAAGEEETAKRRALKATAEQNEQRLTAIEDERAAIEAQLAVLQSSGDTSEQVTGQINQLNAELGSLGNESQFIQGTALALSKERDAQKKAVDDAKKAAEEAERNQEQANQKRLEAAQNYSEALIDIATDAADAADDALTSLQDALTQNELDFSRDMDQLTVDANRSRLESEIEAQQQEATELREHQRKLEGIRDDALRDENDALRKRDFLSAARIRESANAELEAENQAFEEGQAERDIAEQEAQARELRELENARADRLAQLHQANEDARTAYDLQLRDNEIAQDRQRRDAAIARDREIAAANELANSILQVKTAQGAAEIQIAANTLQGIANMAASFVPPQMNFAGGAGGNTTNNQNINSLGQLNMPIQTVIAPEMLQTIIMSTIDSIGLMPNN